MRIIKILANPLFGATVLVAMGASWTFAFLDAKRQAAFAASSVSEWSGATRAQLAQVAACDSYERAPAGPRSAASAMEAYQCAAKHLLAQEKASSAATAQVFARAAASAMEQAALGLPAPQFPMISELYDKAARDAAESTAFAEKADRALLAHCSRPLSSLACDVGRFAPDSPDRRLADPLREFELDLHAQYWNATNPSQALQALGSKRVGAMSDPAYAYARSKISRKLGTEAASP